MMLDDIDICHHCLLVTVCHDFIKRNSPKSSGGVLKASCHFLRLGPINRVTSSDMNSHAVLLRQTHVVRQDPWEDT